MFKRVYYFVDELDIEWYNELLRFIDLLNINSYEEIYDKHFKLWTDKLKDNSTYWYWTNLEAFLFAKYLKDKWINDFKLLYRPELFILNEKLFIIQNRLVEEIELENTAFYTLRTDFNHPFHEILDIILKKKWWIINKPTFRPIESTSQERNKFFGIIWLYNDREKFLGNMVIPYWILKENYEIFLNFIKNNFNTKVAIKKDWYQCREWISMLNLKSSDLEFNIKKASEILNNHSNSRYASYITPFYKFKKEYRIYFIKKWANIKIYSVKQKNLEIDSENVFLWDTFKENMYFKWDVLEKKDWLAIDHIFENSYKMISLMNFETWNLEFWETEDGKIIFFEVNPMWSPMIFKWEDENNIHEYYMDLFDFITNNINYE